MRCRSPQQINTKVWSRFASTSPRFWKTKRNERRPELHTRRYEESQRGTTTIPCTRGVSLSLPSQLKFSRFRTGQRENTFAYLCDHVVIANIAIFCGVWSSRKRKNESYCFLVVINCLMASSRFLRHWATNCSLDKGCFAISSTSLMQASSYFRWDSLM